MLAGGRRPAPAPGTGRRSGAGGPGSGRPARPVSRSCAVSAPADFAFAVKAWQPITHEQRSPTERRLRERSAPRRSFPDTARLSPDTGEPRPPAAVPGRDRARRARPGFRAAGRGTGRADRAGPGSPAGAGARRGPVPAPTAFCRDAVPAPARASGLPLPRHGCRSGGAGRHARGGTPRPRAVQQRCHAQDARRFIAPARGTRRGPAGRDPVPAGQRL